MASKKIKIRYIGEVEVTKDLYTNVMEVFTEKGFTNKQIYSTLNIGRSTFHNFSKLKLHVSTKMIEFVKLGSEYIYRNYNNEYNFNETKKCFEKVSTPSDIQFNFKGVYYGYFQKPYSNELDYFILSFEKAIDRKDKDGKVRMWSNEKNAFGILILDKSTYSIHLEATDNSNNREFLIGNKSEDTNLKHLIATWRDRNHNIYSLVCMILYISQPNFTKWEEINANKAKIRQDIIKNTPPSANSFLKNPPKNIFTHLDTINL